MLIRAKGLLVLGRVRRLRPGGELRRLVLVLEPLDVALVVGPVELEHLLVVLLAQLVVLLLDLVPLEPLGLGPFQPLQLVGGAGLVGREPDPVQLRRLGAEVVAGREQGEEAEDGDRLRRGDPRGGLGASAMVVMIDLRATPPLSAAGGPGKRIGDLRSARRRRPRGWTAPRSQWGPLRRMLLRVQAIGMSRSPSLRPDAGTRGSRHLADRRLARRDGGFPSPSMMARA